MSPNRDDKTGQFSREYPTAAFLDAVETVDPTTTAKVADAVGCSYDLAYRRLNELADKGQLQRIDVGGSFIWRRQE